MNKLLFAALLPLVASAAPFTFSGAGNSIPEPDFHIMIYSGDTVLSFDTRSLPVPYCAPGCSVFADAVWQEEVVNQKPGLDFFHVVISGPAIAPLRDASATLPVSIAVNIRYAPNGVCAVCINETITGTMSVSTSGRLMQIGVGGVSSTTAPEPSTWGMITGAVGVGLWRRFRLRRPTTR